ncbi:MAG: serralysin, partial [Chloroflexia bacterium]|nr:serralysin [Chloroflexia bacterium]
MRRYIRKLRYPLAALAVCSILVIMPVLTAMGRFSPAAPPATVLLSALASLTSNSPSAPAVASTFSNSTPITITVTQIGGTNPYPSPIQVTGMTGAVSKVTVQLKNLTHDCVQDMDILLVSPTGQNTLLMSDVGGGASPSGMCGNGAPANPYQGISNLTFTIDDSAALTMPGTLTATAPLTLTTGTYKPTNYGSPPFNPDTFPTTVDFVTPPNNGNASLGVFNGSNPNGVWNLYIVDDGNQNPPLNGRMGLGWSLTIDTVPAAPATYVVNSTNDPGTGVCDANECTLHEAILAANGNSGRDTINFAIPGSGVRLINVVTEIPKIFEPVVINGYSQTGSTAN